MDNRKIYLYLAILIPIVMIIIIAISVVSFSHTIYPKYKFLYGNIKKQNYYACLQKFKSELLGTPNPTPFRGQQQKPVTCEQPTLYVYDFTNKTSTKVTFEEAKQFIIKDNDDDLDGFRVSSFCNLGSPLGWWWSDDSYNGNLCLRQKGYQERLNIKPEADTYFILLGWITGNKNLGII